MVNNMYTETAGVLQNISRQDRRVYRKLKPKVMAIIIGAVGLLYVAFNKPIAIEWRPFLKCNDSNAYKKSEASFKRTDAVILLTMMRSGSSILGSIFDARQDVTYVYEPLFPFHRFRCEEKVDERLRILRLITRCDLQRATQLYSKLYLYEQDSRCRDDSLCFMEGRSKFSRFLSRDMDMCQITEGEQVCKHPIDFTALAKFCRQSTIVAIKTIRLCKLEWLVPLLDDETYQVKIIHLVRDPRGTINSRIAESSNTENIKKHASDVCEQLEPNALFSDIMLSNHSYYRHKYMRVRYEDFAIKPVVYAQKIYDFIGINMVPSIRSWLLEATSRNNPSYLSMSSPQSLKRNARKTVSSWRKALTLQQVQIIQDVCSEAINRLGYKMYTSATELHRTNVLHFEPTL